MSTATLSPKYQIVLPKPIRKEWNIQAGQKFQFFLYDGRIEMIPLEKISKFKGAFPHLSSQNIREKQDRPLPSLS